jgi:hypothetical protein
VWVCGCGCGCGCGCVCLCAVGPSVGDVLPRPRVHAQGRGPGSPHKCSSSCMKSPNNFESDMNAYCAYASKDEGEEFDSGVRTPLSPTVLLLKMHKMPQRPHIRTP